jgi:hypothetical protein
VPHRNGSGKTGTEQSERGGLLSISILSFDPDQCFALA